ncbi:MFS transporter, partial [Modestobacter versicolor]
MTSTLSQPLDRTSRGAGRLLLAAVLLTALDLRTAVTSIGPVLSELRAGTGASAQLLGQLTALPLVCFAVVGSAAPATARRLGSYRTLAAAMALMAAGLLLRAVSDAPGTLLACTALALVGGAVGNVLLPVLVKEHFADRVGSLTAAYSTALAVGATLAAGTTVPLAEWAGRGSAAG